jgi:alpha-beta hydrolase superfamily lysophospholipase
MQTVRVITSTETGVVDPCEAPTVALYGYEAAMRHRDTARIAVPGGETHLDVYPATGTARGSVVFVGGLSNHALGSADFEWKLSQRGWNVVAVDVRGHGRSSGGRGDFTIEALLDDLRGAAAYAHERFGVPVAVMGSSLGGYYALLAANAIDLFTCAVSHWIFLPDQPVTAKDRRIKPVALLLNKVAPWVKLPTRPLANWDAVNQDPVLRQKCFDDPMMVWKYSVRALAGGMAYKPARPLTDLRIPHLVVLGEEDQMTPRPYTEGIYAQLRGEKEWKTIPGAGHMGGLVEYQDEMLGIVDEFLGRRLAIGRPSGDAAEASLTN